jgi:hypothetical protein
MTPFPRPLESYVHAAADSLLDLLVSRATVEPVNLVATLIFVLAILHTFLAPKMAVLAHRLSERTRGNGRDEGGAASAAAEVLHFFGEVEVVFGLWCVPLLVAITVMKGWHAAAEYVSHGVSYTEPLFVVVIMTIAASRPVLDLAEDLVRRAAKLGGESPAAWWISILTIGPILGSFITEPAAMTISALLLARQFFRLDPGVRLRYGTLGLLFVNVSVGGTLTHFAAPPVLMVAGTWGWDLAFMFGHFGWKALVGLVLSNVLYFVVFRKDFSRLKGPTWPVRPDGSETKAMPVPAWVTAVHVAFIAWTVATAHFPPLFIGGFLFFIGFTQATRPHQNELDLRPPLLVGFFLAGLVVHGGLQSWWIAPVLSRLAAFPMMAVAMVLTAFNDNAAITYLASLVPGLAGPVKYAALAGAVAGGGMTVIANAPNPAGQSLLSRFFPDGAVSPLSLAIAALTPTLLVAACFWLL